MDEQQSLIQYGDLAFGSRPTHPNVAYCGIDEFEGRYYCHEVKNSQKNIQKKGDKSCNDFSSEVIQPVGSCRDCRHLHRVPPNLVRDLEEVAGRYAKGEQTKNELKQKLLDQATSEFEECVQQVGILRSSPGFLSVCEARSLSEDDDDGPQHIVGPVLNVKGECHLWERGDNERTARMSKEFTQLMDDAKSAAALADHQPDLPYQAMDPFQYMHDLDLKIRLFHSLAANAEADVLAYGLKWLNIDAAFIEYICSQHMREVWFVTDRVDCSNLTSEPWYGMGNFRYLLIANPPGVMETFDQIAWMERQQMSAATSLIRDASRFVQLFVPISKQMQNPRLLLLWKHRVFVQQMRAIPAMKPMVDLYDAKMFPWLKQQGIL